MKCAECEGETNVITTLKTDYSVFRKRKCEKCGYIFMTEEIEVIGEDLKEAKRHFALRRKRRRNKC